MDTSGLINSSRLFNDSFDAFLIRRLSSVCQRVDKSDRSGASLALACIDCNLRKGPNLTGIDPETAEITPLFNPRKQAWSKHFDWQGVQIAGKTACGRTTIVVLDMNSEDQLGLRLS